LLRLFLRFGRRLRETIEERHDEIMHALAALCEIRRAGRAARPAANGTARKRAALRFELYRCLVGW
jgi:hypothetical protein